VADLVLLDADPLRDIRNTTAINSVVVRGRVIDPTARQRMLDGVKKAAAGAPGRGGRALRLLTIFPIRGLLARQEIPAPRTTGSRTSALGPRVADDEQSFGGGYERAGLAGVPRRRGCRRLGGAARRCDGGFPRTVAG
jgi:hypothetical protein